VAPELVDGQDEHHAVEAQQGKNRDVEVDLQNINLLTSCFFYIQINIMVMELSDVFGKSRKRNKTLLVDDTAFLTVVYFFFFKTFMLLNSNSNYLLKLAKLSL
jgi:hypothetical protein